MDNTGGRGRFVALAAHADGGGVAVHPGEAVGGDFADEADVVEGREEVEVLRPPDLGVGEDAVAEEEPPGSPALAVIGPLVQHARHRRLLLSPPAVRSAHRETRRQAPRPRQRRSLRRVPTAPDPRTLQGDAAQRVHFLHSHCLTPSITKITKIPFFFLVFDF